MQKNQKGNREIKLLGRQGGVRTSQSSREKKKRKRRGRGACLKDYQKIRKNSAPSTHQTSIARFHMKKDKT